MELDISYVQLSQKLAQIVVGRGDEKFIQFSRLFETLLRSEAKKSAQTTSIFPPVLWQSARRLIDDLKSRTSEGIPATVNEIVAVLDALEREMRPNPLVTTVIPNPVSPNTPIPAPYPWGGIIGDYLPPSGIMTCKNESAGLCAPSMQSEQNRG
jgi:hypothetical protein